jgi:hypothetical protein
MRKRIFSLFILFSFLIHPSSADEGMWLPWFLPQSKINTMQEMGMQLTPEEIFSTSQPSLKDAIVSLDDGSCTGSFISNKGLILTNHHCANSDIQKHSSVEEDLLTNGFWAQSPGQEIPNPGKTATLLIDARNLSPLFTAELKNTENQFDIDLKIDSLSTIILDTLSLEPSFDASIIDFNFNNDFFLIITQTFQDVRLVAAPPEDVAQFGGEKDNWTWPRHSADFALYRVYCSPDGEPADYHTDNIPYSPKHVLEISTLGITAGDFSLTMGYPGNTQRYLTAEGIKETRNIINPMMNDLLDIKQKIWEKHMAQSRATQIQYSEKYATLMNYSQYITGQSKSIEELNIIQEQKQKEEKIQRWIKENPEVKENYGNLLSSTEILYQMRENLTRTSFLTLETILAGTEMGQFVLESFELFSLINSTTSTPEQAQEEAQQLKEKANHFYNNFSPQLDREVFLEMVSYYRKNLSDSIRLNDSTLLGKYENAQILADAIYNQSFYSSKTRFDELLNTPKLMNFLADPAFSFQLRVLQEFGPVYSMFNRIDRQIDYSMHRYFNMLQLKYPDKNFYPNANSTMRLSYGAVAGYSPEDGIFFSPFTTPKGITEKIKSGKEAYQTEIDFKQLFEKKWSDYFKDAPNPILCFITTNDISGGNSGSPVLNKQGQLIGLAFDGNREGMASDLEYSPRFQRCINVDIRYILFLIDKLGNSTQLLEEMKIK